MLSLSKRPETMSSTPIYKYCNANGVKILQNLELKITPPNQFNDPFEFSPQTITSAPQREIKDALKNKVFLRELYSREMQSGNFNGSFREYRKKIKDDRASLISPVVDGLKTDAKVFQSSFPKHISSRLGVLCLSETRESIVMWGHYADKHHGIVIGFDRSWEVFHEKTGMRPVLYRRERAVWDTSCPPKGQLEQEMVENLVFSKNIEWSYEAEVRQLFQLNGLRRVKSNEGELLYFQAIPPEIVLTVSLGTRCPTALEKDVRLALRDPRLKHVKLDRAELHESEYALKFR